MICNYYEDEDCNCHNFSKGMKRHNDDIGTNQTIEDWDLIFQDSILNSHFPLKKQLGFFLNIVIYSRLIHDENLRKTFI